MIDKVVGYHAFQSYGTLPYPSLKSGQRTLDTNVKWAQSIFALISPTLGGHPASLFERQLLGLSL